MHYLSPEIVNAERLSPTRVKAGWSDENVFAKHFFGMPR